MTIYERKAMRTSLSKNLMTLMSEGDYTCAEIGRAVGVHAGAVVSWRLGVSTPRPDHVEALASFFKVNKEWLCHDVGERNAEVDHGKRKYQRRKLCDRIQYLISESDVTQTEIAKAIYVSASQITEWKYGTEIPRQENLEALARYFKVSMMWLKYGEGEPGRKFK